MLRLLCLLAVAVLAVCLFAETALAQTNTWPRMPLDVNDPNSMPRGPGGYFSWLKLGLVMAVYLSWVRTTEWANRDCQTLGLPYSVWNLVVAGPFLAGLVAVLTIPLFAAGFAVYVLAWLIPLVVYVVKHNSVVEPQERVMTPAHLRYVLARQIQKLGVDVGTEAKAAHEKGTPVVFEALGGTHQQNQSNIISARQSPGYLQAKELVAELVRQRAEKGMLDFTRDAVAVRFQIDGVWHESEAQDRESGDAILAVYKSMANLNVDERRKRQVGRFDATYEGRTYQSTIMSQGTQTGERVILQLDRPHSDLKTLRELGMREKMEEQLRDALANDHGLVLISSSPGGGLTTTVRLVLSLVDRYMRDIVAFQEKNAQEPVAENIEITTYDKAAGESPQRVLESLLRKEPSGVVVNELPNVECAQMLCEHAVDGKLVITTIRAKEAVEALLRVLLLKLPASKFAPAVTAVLNQRLIRKLCDECKQPYQPAPQLLQKLGIPAGRIDQLYRPPDPAEQDKVCRRCNGIGYYGRTSIFELLLVNDKIREALETQPKLDVLRKISREAGNRNLQQEGIVLVAQGTTSVQELSRVLKQ
jgi:type II secretory ATPase GspE/PulE/Tfp pilus assembly ATPase PilB-like protein